ncbi:MAG: endo-1,4-beta-glucanase [Myxococcales bacterium]|nr:endo-1,4-beta-glucanase [Myxococcales bacterium]MCB9578360.1 SGNH/GDSL hydrolase family protein [Polyangiaceae bacterium]
MGHRIWIVALGLSLFSFGCSSDDSGGSPASGGMAGASGSSSGGSGGAAGSGGGSGGATGGAGGSGGATGGAAGAAGSGGNPGVPEVRFVGRTDDSETGVVKMAWSGSGILFRFDGTEASVTLDDPAGFWTVLVDGAEQPRLETQKGEQKYVVATGLAAGEHEVRMYRRTEASFGATRYLGVDLGGGMLLPPPPPAAHRIEVIGDSITCGYGNEGADQYCNFSADTENHYITYGAIAARNLNAEVVTVAWSGKGVIFNYGTDTNEPMPELYERILPYSSTPAWDFSKWQPEVVVINLGTNDYSTGGDPTDKQFTDAYVAFLENIRQKNPNALILAMVPTLLSGTDLSTAQKNVEAAVAARKSAGDSNVYSYFMSVTMDGWGCDWHPSAKTHAAMGASLTQELKTRLGW